MGKILGLGSEDMPTIGYARVSSHDQKNDLVRQQELLEAFCAAKGWRHEIIAGLQRLLELILFKRIRRLVLTHKERALHTVMILITSWASKKRRSSPSRCTIPEGRIGALTESMQETQFKAMLLYAELLKKRKDEDVAGS